MLSLRSKPNMRGTKPIRVCNVEQRRARENVIPITREGGRSDSKSPHWRHWKLSGSARVRGLRHRWGKLIYCASENNGSPHPALKLIDDQWCIWLCFNRFQFLAWWHFLFLLRWLSSPSNIGLLQIKTTISILDIKIHSHFAQVSNWLNHR